MTGVTDTGQGSAQSAVPTRRQQLIEVGVFLFLCMPGLVLSAFRSEPARRDFLLDAIWVLCWGLGLTALVLFLLWRDREPRSAIGWSLRKLWTDIPLGVALFLPVHLSAAWGYALFRSLGLPDGSRPLPSYCAPEGPTQLVLAVVLIAVLALVDETIFRGYLILRFTTITRSAPVAVALAAVFFAVEHAYQGPAGIATTGIVGLSLGLIYVWRRTLVAPVVVHFLANVLYIIAPALFAL